MKIEVNEFSRSLLASSFVNGDVIRLKGRLSGAHGLKGKVLALTTHWNKHNHGMTTWHCKTSYPYFL